MDQSNSITFEQICRLVDSALNDFYTNDAILLDYATEDKAVSERCMVFRIGWYMLKHMESDPIFKNYNLDCEYNRNFDHEKSAYIISRAGILADCATFPDLLIHRRRSNSDNLLVIEFKKGHSKDSNPEKLQDIRKLEYFTDQSKAYKYRLGLHIELCKKRALICPYENGKRISNKYYSLSKQN